MYESNPITAFVWSGWTATWPTQLLALIWAAWLISWLVGSFFSARTEKHVRTWDSRAYRIPILIGAMIATGIAVGTATALLGTALIAFGLWQKARMEEGFLTTELGADAYGPYCRRVPMLVPFLPQR